MTKNKLIYWGAATALLISFIAFSLYNRYSRRTPDAKKFIETIRDQNKAGLDSLQNAINYENDLNNRIKKSISSGDFNTAYALMDSLPAFGKTHSIHLYQGMIYTEQKKYPEAIEEYNAALNKQVFSIALEKRGDVYVKMNKLDMAMNDYKKAYNWNFDYSLQIANTFALLNKKDSALKYYQIYLEHYPDDTAAQQKISLLKPH